MMHAAIKKKTIFCSMSISESSDSSQFGGNFFPHFNYCFFSYAFDHLDIDSSRQQFHRYNSLLKRCIYNLTDVLKYKLVKQ